jgi:hypothetical protein
MDTLIPTVIILAAVAAIIGLAIGVNKLHDRKRRREWESGKYGATGLGVGAAGGAAGIGGASGFCGAGGGCTGAGGSGCAGGGGGCGGGCGGGGCGGGG